MLEDKDFIMTTISKNLLDLLNDNGELHNGLIAKTIGDFARFEVIGFIPIRSDIYILELVGFGITNACIKIAPFSNDRSNFSHPPIAFKLSKNNIKTYVIQHDKPIMLCNESIDYSIRDYFHKKEYLCNKRSELFEKDDTKFWYKVQNSDIIFERNDNIVGISSNFLCLCSYVSPKTGKIEYAIKFPEELIPTINI